ncbi:hypothetical protein FHX42_003874 [Saccharopolyspora lacisalsi]|uniref:Prenyltransferase n=1 Tax=Halosaccharopolyspora lacisalsi TaxID=1000566 RepID=A0A839E6I5_9PSEU|nr:prenyltransferase [Halosaccharopolyspora lacisalsi]MBA8826498.1 hypothetical protein [Halosaccharopolyspora lacisalsi]
MADIPELTGVLSASEVLRTAATIAETQEPSGAIPWFTGGHVDPWDHVESAMALSAAGSFGEAEHAYDWLLRTQRDDGSWPLRVRAGRVEDAASDTNFCAYLAVGVWQHLLITGDDGFAVRMWPAVRRAMNFVLGAQREDGEMDWALDERGVPVGEALLSGCSSIHHSLRCALALAEYLGSSQPDWEVALGCLGNALRCRPEAFTPKHRYSMDWYYPVLGGAVRGRAARRRLSERWTDFVVDGLGVRCVDDHPWVTGAETCELVLSLDAVEQRAPALELLSAIQHLRDPDGSYWTGLVYADGKRWPEERTTWTGAAMILAVDALSRATPGNGIFRAEDLPAGLAAEECQPPGSVSDPLDAPESGIFSLE